MDVAGDDLHGQRWWSRLREEGWTLDEVERIAT
jgi:hypothetical protein